jgi:hypothetical protein
MLYFSTQAFSRLVKNGIKPGGNKADSLESLAFKAPIHLSAAFLYNPVFRPQGFGEELSGANKSGFYLLACACLAQPAQKVRNWSSEYESLCLGIKNPPEAALGADDVAIEDGQVCLLLRGLNNAEGSVFLDLLDGAHGALFHAVGAGGASVLIDDSSRVTHDVQHILRAGIDADPASGALVGVDYRSGHNNLLSVTFQHHFLMRLITRLFLSGRNIYETLMVCKRISGFFLQLSKQAANTTPTVGKTWRQR